MILSLETKYASLNPFENRGLPDLVVLTGINGSGKTQILKGIMEGDVSIFTDTGTPIQKDRIAFVDLNSLVPDEAMSPDSLIQLKNTAWQDYCSLTIQSQNNPQVWAHMELYSFRFPFEINHIAQISGKPINQLTKRDFDNHFPAVHPLKDIFSSIFSRAFLIYNSIYLKNKLSQFLAPEGLPADEFISDEEFKKIHGEPPWEIVNRLLALVQMPFTINKPKLDLEEPFQVRLVTSDGDEVNMTDLSSGEKTILSLISLQFKNSLSLKFPKVLLLDEPDSVLHPSMSKKFMDVVSEFLVKEKKIKVIMTTHSPSTISFTPPEYIFVVNKEGDRIQHVSCDKALKALTVGVPSFSVNYENRRQVFVESDFDQSFYTQLYGVLSNWLDPEISLYFISSGETRVNQNGTKISNCERVIAITDMMRGYGNNFVFVIIDRDESNDQIKLNSGHEVEYLKVLGRGNRYAIENYFLNPLILGAFVVKFNIVDKKDLGFSEGEYYTDMSSFTLEKLQAIVNNLMVLLMSIFPPNGDITLKDCQLINGKTVQIPNWFLTMRGHTLEEKILDKTMGGKLNKFKGSNEGAFKNEIFNQVISDIPGLLSMDILQVFSDIQND